MRFGKQLRNSIYKPWEGHYIAYAKLKNILREDEDDETWTEDDENRFCDELLNVQLEEIAAFRASVFKSLEDRTNKVSEDLRDLAPEDGTAKEKVPAARFKEVEEELDAITNEVNELKKYGNINYTGFLKIAKKHDRRRGKQYKIRPMVQMRLSRRPFNSEQSYTPLLNKLSLLYYVVRQQLDESTDLAAIEPSDALSQTHNGERYVAHKFWVPMDNLLEVRTLILRRLPILVYSEQSSKGLESQDDPTLSSLYFDNADFFLYNQKLDRPDNSSSVRIRWTGELKSNPELALEQNVIHNGASEERRFRIKPKYIQAFIKGEYKMEKTIRKMERQGQPAATIEEFKHTVESIQEFIMEKDLQPVLRANYTRTAFQKPQDDKVRISVDSNLAFIREDSLDLSRPCRNPDDWHRLDVDFMDYPFSSIRQGEISRFPYAVLEIKVREDGVKKHPQWIEELMSSHLVHKVPRFSKFVYGVASLFEDNVNNLPFWLSEVETDIHKDPHDAFEEEEERKARKAEAELVVGSLLGTSKPGTSFKPAVSSPVPKSYMQERLAAEDRSTIASTDFAAERRISEPVAESSARGATGYGTLASVFPSFSLSRYAQARREREHSVALPPGVNKPPQLIKDSGPLQIEPKVWLANERTYLKWQQICFLLGAFAIVLSNASGNDKIRMAMGITYLVVALFAAGWGYYIHRSRRGMIIERSGKDFDNVIGPIVVSFALMIALIANFAFRYRAAVELRNWSGGNHSTTAISAEKPWTGKIELL
ncbi:Uncharacterized protein BP5553_02622 [Venustampulla echinocandica]|uniref:SPX domain-containing protein n=1 Tax=Venustampulla echinocandica TaxID=2656787 RepID=A0A370TRX2_9HELO|nr:Uncharacterized protein BP5553_02622 [Venustampulla echinocandica]RDL38282.1 Uncharacterized protein BP5553_02622 [Venustampulla echinocandica]